MYDVRYVRTMSVRCPYDVRTLSRRTSVVRPSYVRRTSVVRPLYVRRTSSHVRSQVDVRINPLWYQRWYT